MNSANLRPLFFCLATLSWSAKGSAHPLAPIALNLRQTESALEVSLKRARVQPRNARFTLRPPPTCARTGPSVMQDEEAFITERFELACTAPLEGSRFGVDGLTEAHLDAVVSVSFQDGRAARGLLNRSTDTFTVPEKLSTARWLWALARSGALHLWQGADHVLFVLGLTVWLWRPRRVLLALTAFTVGHGLSMFAAALGVVSIPSFVAEAGIAATLVWLGWELLRAPGAQGGLGQIYAVALAVGLIHGLGFASSFSGAHLAGKDLALALTAFHVGIELAQLGVVACALLLLRALQKWQTPVRVWLAYATGSIAVMWLLERVSGA